MEKRTGKKRKGKWEGKVKRQSNKHFGIQYDLMEGLEPDMFNS